MSIAEPISIRDEDGSPTDPHHFLHEPVGFRYVVENAQSHNGIKSVVRIRERRTARAVQQLWRDSPSLYRNAQKIR